MVFLAFVGALCLFVVLMLLLPRTAFTVTLAVCLSKAGVAIWVGGPNTATTWQTCAMLVIILGTITSIVADILTINAIKDS